MNSRQLGKLMLAELNGGMCNSATKIVKRLRERGLRDELAVQELNI